MFVRSLFALAAAAAAAAAISLTALTPAHADGGWYRDGESFVVDFEMYGGEAALAYSSHAATCGVVASPLNSLSFAYVGIIAEQDFLWTGPGQGPNFTANIWLTGAAYATGPTDNGTDGYAKSAFDGTNVFESGGTDSAIAGDSEDHLSSVFLTSRSLQPTIVDETHAYGNIPEMWVFAVAVFGNPSPYELQAGIGGSSAGWTLGLITIP